MADGTGFLSWGCLLADALVFKPVGGSLGAFRPRPSVRASPVHCLLTTLTPAAQ